VTILPAWKLDAIAAGNFEPNARPARFTMVFMWHPTQCYPFHVNPFPLMDRYNLFRLAIFLKSASLCSRSQAEYPHIVVILPIGDEFRERIGFGGSEEKFGKGVEEKFGKGVAQRVCNDKRRWLSADHH
jgi:hypothetical protein